MGGGGGGGGGSRADWQAYACISHCPVRLAEGTAVIHVDLEENAPPPSTLHPNLSRGLMSLLTPDTYVHLRGLPPEPPSHCVWLLGR